MTEVALVARKTSRNFHAYDLYANDRKFARIRLNRNNTWMIWTEEGRDHSEAWAMALTNMGLENAKLKDFLNGVRRLYEYELREEAFRLEEYEEDNYYAVQQSLRDNDPVYQNFS